MLNQSRVFKLNRIEDLLSSSWSDKLGLLHHKSNQANDNEAKITLLATLLVNETWPANQAFSITKSNTMNADTTLYLLNDSDFRNSDNTRASTIGKLWSISEQALTIFNRYNPESKKTSITLFTQWDYLECQSISPKSIESKILEVSKRIRHLLLYQEQAAKRFYLMQAGIPLELQLRDRHESRV
jgi:hypothetical protein